MAMKIPNHKVPLGLFGAPNPMTPRVVGYYRLADGRYVEVSTSRNGSGMTGRPVHGVTVRPNPGSKLIHGTLADAEAYIDSLDGGQDA